VLSRIFVLLSGEHPTLPKAEVEAVLDAEGYDYTVVKSQQRYLRLEASEEAGYVVGTRSSYCHFCFMELVTCEVEDSQIEHAITKAPLNAYFSPQESFAVRLRNIQGGVVRGGSPKLESKIGGYILDSTEGLHVDLEKPDHLFLGILLDDRLICGPVLGEVNGKNFAIRFPRRKPFYHPSSLQPKLARCMVNLSRASKRGIILDPFCGTGTIPIEAGLMGIEAVGIDIQRRMVQGSKINLDYYKVRNVHLIRANSLLGPVKEANFMATDPPYGGVASTYGLPTAKLLKQFLAVAYDILASGGYLCMAFPERVNLISFATDLGFKPVEKHRVYVHRSLTREIVVFRQV
jgi:tRNA (guanine10-N2)-dimethyltransferase